MEVGSGQRKRDGEGRRGQRSTLVRTMRVTSARRRERWRRERGGVSGVALLAGHLGKS